MSLKNTCRSCKSRNLVENVNDWIDFFEEQLFYEIIKKDKNLKNSDRVKKELKAISQFCRLKTNGLLNPLIDTKSVSYDFNHDILDWIDNFEIESDLGKYVLDKRRKYIFSYTSEQIEVRNDVFKRYGTSINSLSKIVTRISNLESQFRKVRYENDTFLRDVYKRIGENFTRYALSN